MVERPHMGVRDVAHVNVVAHAAAVWRAVVVSVNANRPAAACGGKHQRNQVGFRIVRFADVALRIRPGGVEIAQCHPPQAASDADIRKHSLNEQFGAAVWIDGTLRMVLGNGTALG